jgi:hypothetical protein
LKLDNICNYLHTLHVVNNVFVLAMHSTHNLYRL